MKDHPTERLLKSLNKEFNAEEQLAFDRDLAGSEELRKRRDQLQRTQSLLQQTVADSAEDALLPFFSDRLMRRLRAELNPKRREEEWTGALLGIFRPVALACIIVILALATYNVTVDPYEAEQSTAEAVLGLPPVAVVVAYDVEFNSNMVDP